MKIKNNLIIDVSRPMYNNFDNRKLERTNYYYISDYCDYNFFGDLKHDYFSRDTTSIKKTFESIRSSKFKLFFKNLTIDTPAILNRTHSLNRNQNFTDFGKLAICLTRGGKKIQASNLISKAIFSSFKEVTISTTPTFPVFDTRLLYYYFTTLNVTGLRGLPVSFYNLSNFKLALDNVITDDHLIKSEDFTPEFFFKKSIKMFNLLFSFYIYKVDKNIYKNSRGKSGKYSFVWKYVPPYKRSTLIAQWLMKEVRISPGKNIQDRVNFIIRKFFLFTKETLA